MVGRARSKLGKRRRQKAAVPRITAPSHSVRVEGAGQRVYSLHHAVLVLLDGTIETLGSAQDDEAVHAARKACKRIRAALRLLRECLGPSVYRRENRNVRDAAKPLTGVRDAFMLRRVLRTLPARPAILQRALDSEYRGERQALERRGARAALKQLMATRGRLVELPAVDSEAASVIAGVKRIYKEGRRASSEARSREDRALHEWRKQAKYLVNQLELLEIVFDVEFKRLHRHAQRLAETLGDDHDLGVLTNEMRRHEEDEPSLSKQIEKRRAKLQAGAFRLGKRVYRHSAKHLETRLRARLSKSPHVTPR
jgi:CHAD domain-containing protein